MARALAKRGLFTYYADESDDKTDFAMATVRIPTFHPVRQIWGIYWDDFLDAAKQWRRGIQKRFLVPISKELKGSYIATGRNYYWKGKGRIHGKEARDLYQYALETLTFLPKESIFSVYAEKGYSLYGYTKLEASLYALFQRMQRQSGAHSQALIFFDEGHNEYRRLYRKACVHLPTGSKMGLWHDGHASANIPFSAAVKDLNFKDSKQSYFVQIADLVAYATLLKARSEHNRLSDREKELGFGDIHDYIPRSTLNTFVVTGGKDGIVRLKK